MFQINRDILDVVKQSAALWLLRLFRTEPNVIPGGEWTTRIIHLLNDQVYCVKCYKIIFAILSFALVYNQNYIVN